MCDYSLHGYATRIAEVGQNLILRFFHPSSKGFADAIKQPPNMFVRAWNYVFNLPNKVKLIPDTTCVICIPPGARLTVSGISLDIMSALGVNDTEEVTFTQVSAEENQHRDALQFKNGKILLLQKFPKGLHATVLSLGDEASEYDLVYSDEHMVEVVTRRS